MKCFNEVFVPSGWIITTNEASQNLSSTAWPQVQETCENVFDLNILTNTKNDEEPNSEKHQLILNFIYGNNEISLVQESDCIKRKSIIDDEIEAGGNFGRYNARNNMKDKTVIGRFWRKWTRLMKYDFLGSIVMPFARLKLEFWIRAERHRLKV